MTENKVNLKFGIVVLMILFAAAIRFIPINNFSPLGGMALFGAAYFTRKYWAFLIPFVALWLSDLILNNTIYAHYYDGFVWFGDLGVYISFALIVVLGFFLLKKVNLTNVLIGSVSASVLFFIVTNLGVWMSGTLYPMTLSGLGACFTAAIPFFQGTFLSDLFYCGVLFGGFELVNRYLYDGMLSKA